MAALAVPGNRRLAKVVVGYLAGGWLVLELVRALAARGTLPEVAPPVVLIWFLCGIPGAVIIAGYHGGRERRRITRTRVALLFGVVIVALTGSGTTIGETVVRQHREAVAEASHMALGHVAVLYFDDLTPGQEAGHLADGLTEILMRALATAPELSVVSRNGVASFRGRDIPRDRIARRLRVGTVVDGRVEPLGDDRFRVTIRLVDGQTGEEFDRTGVEGTLAELVGAPAALGREAVRPLREWLGHDVTLRTLPPATGSIPAWALYQRGEKARKEAEAALPTDPDDAAAAFDRADALLAQAELVDPGWVAATVLRARIAERRARLADDPASSLAWIGAGLRHVDRALAVSPAHAEALEVRGALRYLSHLRGVGPDPGQGADLLELARLDLERAVDLDPTLASAYATLNDLYGQAGDTASMVLAGRRAYHEDPYVQGAEAVLFRTMSGAYDLEQLPEALRWCQEGAWRYPADPRFLDCRLRLMTTPVLDADVDTAWALLGRIEALAPGDGSPEPSDGERLRARLHLAGVLARAGLPDSARSVLDRAIEGPTPPVPSDPGIRALERRIRSLLDSAVAGTPGPRKADA